MNKPNTMVVIAEPCRTIINGLSMFAIKAGACGGPVFASAGCTTHAKNTALPTQTAPGKMCNNLRTAISASMVSPSFLYEIS
jgi:hypothetical protein